MTVTSLITGRRYTSTARLGEGGFGTAYRATVAGGGVRKMPDEVCLKLTTDQPSWHVEAYFGELLRGEPRAIAVFEAFPVVRRVNGRPRQQFALVTELAPHGDLLHFLEARRAGLPERKALREFRRLLAVLDRLHTQGAMHRDITPGNVFVFDGLRLKLGDFGIVKQGTSRGNATATRFAPWFVAPEIRDGRSPYWLPADDVYQAGQILGMLISGDTSGPIEYRAVADLPCSAATKRVIRRCIGPRRSRFGTAREVIEAVTHGIARLPRARVSSLRGYTVVITGRLSIPRHEAVRRLTRAGAIVQPRVCGTTDILIRGVDRYGQPMGQDGGRKVEAADAARVRGQRIVELTEGKLRRLVKGWPDQHDR